jgi:hypothetical protein
MCSFYPVVLDGKRRMAFNLCTGHQRWRCSGPCCTGNHQSRCQRLYDNLRAEFPSMVAMDRLRCQGSALVDSQSHLVAAPPFISETMLPSSVGADRKLTNLHISASRRILVAFWKTRRRSPSMIATRKPQCEGENPCRLPPISSLCSSREEFVEQALVDSGHGADACCSISVLASCASHALRSLPR